MFILQFTVCKFKYFLIQDSIDEKGDIPVSPQDSLEDVKEIVLEEENSVKDKDLNKV